MDIQKLQRRDFFVLAVALVGIVSIALIGGKTFASTLLSDTFTGTVLDAARWNKYDTGGKVNQNDVLTIGGNNTWAKNGIESAASFARGNTLTFEVVAKASATNGYVIPVGYGDFGWYPYTTAKEAGFIEFYNNGTFQLFRVYNGFAENRPTGVAYVANRWYKIQMIVGDTAGATFKVYQDLTGDKDFDDANENVDLLATATNRSLTGGTFTNKKFFSMNYSSAVTLSVDDVLVTNSVISAVPAVTITSPTALLTIQDQFYAYTVPWIQSSSTIAATADGANLATGGGLEFVLDKGTGAEVSSKDMTSPYATTFTGVVKGTHTLDVYALKSDAVTRETNAEAHQQVSNIGVGDVIALFGDSTSAGSVGNSVSGAVTSCATSTYHSADCRNIEQRNGNSSITGPLASFHVELGDKLAAYYQYPVIIQNEAWGSSNTNHLLTSIFGQSQLENRLTALAPNKFIISEGVNDVRCEVNGEGLCTGGTWTAAAYGARLQSIIDYLKTHYGATNDQIWLARFNYDSTPGIVSEAPGYLAQVASVVAANPGVHAGANLWDYFKNHQSYITDTVHPNVAGYTQIARIWGLAMMQPQHLVATQNGASVTLTWDNLASIESSVAGYKLKYGSTSGTYSTVIDVGNATTYNLTGLTNGQTYYFTVSAYDNNTTVADETMNSAETSLTYVFTNPDTTAPTLSLSALDPDPNTDTTPSLTGTANDTDGTVASVEFQIDGVSGTWSACSADDGSFDSASEAFTCTTPTLADGAHAILVRATDAAGHTTANPTLDAFTIGIPMCTP